MKIIRTENELTVVLDNGNIINTSNCTDELYSKIMNVRYDEKEIKKLLLPEFENKKAEVKKKQELFEGIDDSSILTVKGQSMYMLDVSELSLPEDLVKRILKAEIEGDVDTLESYINFWTLTSLNPDSRVRQNLFWFLNKYGMSISKSGLFVAYRNVHIKNKNSIISTDFASTISSAYVDVKFNLRQDPLEYTIYYDNQADEYVTLTDIEYNYLIDEYNQDLLFGVHCDCDNQSLYGRFCECDYDVEDHPKYYLERKGNLLELYESLSDDPVAPIYTDGWTKTFNIKIGEVVSMPREECDSVQENSCSSGLHVAGKDWLSKNYFGDVGMMVLVNPADVVAVPPIDNYGKMRTAAYYPVSVVEFDHHGNLISEEFEDGFEDDFIDKIVYSGERNRDDSYPYSIVIPEMPELDKSKINNKLKELAKKFKKVV